MDSAIPHGTKGKCEQCSEHNNDNNRENHNHSLGLGEG